MLPDLTNIYKNTIFLSFGRHYIPDNDYITNLINMLSKHCHNLSFRRLKLRLTKTLINCKIYSFDDGIASCVNFIYCEYRFVSPDFQDFFF